MNITSRCASLVGLCLGLLLSPGATASPRHAVQLLAPDGSPQSASALNDAGRIVGSFDQDGNSRAYLTGAGGTGFTDLGTFGGSGSRAVGINNRGQVLGSFWGGSLADTHVFLTGANGVGMTDLGVFQPLGLNDAGRVLGLTSDNELLLSGAHGAGMVSLGQVGGSLFRADINNRAQVLVSYENGWGNVVDGYDMRSFITAAGGTGRTALETINGWPHTTAFALNDGGQVTGVIHTTQANRRIAHGRSFRSGADGRDLAELEGLGMRERLGVVAGVDINAAGEVVGQYQDPTSDFEFDVRAFASGADGRLHDLTAEVGSGLLPGDYLRYAFGVNDQGQILAQGQGYQYLVSRPVPEPESAGMLFGGLLVVAYILRGRRRSCLPAGRQAGPTDTL